MAVIVLSGADFSAKNIGKINISVDFLAETKGILGRYGVTINQSDTKQKALDTFVLTLKNNGLLGTNGKIKSLALPFLANSISGACINALNGESFFTNSVGDSLSLTSNGLKPVADASVAIINMTSYVSHGNVHFGAYNSSAETNTTTQGRTSCIFGNSNNTYGFRKISGGKVRLWLSNNSGSNTAYGDSSYISTKCFIVANMKTNEATLICDGNIATDAGFLGKISSPAYASSTLENPAFGAYSKTTYASDNDVTGASWAILSLGEALTDAESIAYNNAVKALVSAYGI